MKSPDIHSVPGGRVLCVLSALLALSAFVGPLPTALAAIFTVDSTADDVDASPGDGFCATVANDCTLRAAVQETNALNGEDTVYVPAGIYTLTGAPFEDAAMTGDFDVTDRLKIAGAGAAITIMDGNKLDRVLHVHEGSFLEISGVTVRNGTAWGGGGISVSFGDLTLVGSVVSGNTSTSIPGGGGILVFGGTTIVIDSVIDGNSTVVGGGGLYAQSEATVVLANSRLSNNSASRGGGVEMAGFGTLAAFQTTVRDNDVFEEGGGIETIGNVLLVLIGSTISGNTVQNGSGGGLAVSGTTVLENTTVSGNMVIRGGGGGIRNSSIRGFWANSSTIVNNRSSVAGSAIANDPPIPNPLLLSRSIIAKNVSATGGEQCSGTPITSGGFNLSSDDSCGLLDATDLPNTDPVLGALQDNGGPTFTHALSPDSPAVDAVPNNQCIDIRQNPLTTDQRGVERPQGAACDIGAFEVEVGLRRVMIDIRPYLDDNFVVPNLGSVPVAILTTDDFDAQTVNADTVRFGPAGAEPGLVFFPLRDVNGDNRLDLVLRFRMKDTGIQCGDTEATLVGETAQGLPFEGSDKIQTVFCHPQ